MQWGVDICVRCTGGQGQESGHPGLQDTLKKNTQPTTRASDAGFKSINSKKGQQFKSQIGLN